MGSKVEYPIISDRRIRQFKNEFEPGQVDFVRANKGNLAFHAGLDHEGLQFDSEGMDNLLSQIGLIYAKNTLDCIYPGKQKLYKFTHNGNIWVASGNNCYGEGWSRILLHWDRKFSKKELEELVFVES